jgi:hypothetical protein
MTDKQRKRALERKGEKLRRLAYELESDAAALRFVAGWPGAYLGDVSSYANGVADMASRAGSIGRALCVIAESI